MKLKAFESKHAVIHVSLANKTRINILAWHLLRNCCSQTPVVSRHPQKTKHKGQDNAKEI